MTTTETALHSYRYLLTHKHPEELKQLACVNAALDELTTLRRERDGLREALVAADAMAAVQKKEIVVSESVAMEITEEDWIAKRVTLDKYRALRPTTNEKGNTP